MKENIELRSISELLGMKFFIPSYQRGYRWTEQQVKDLLEDVWEFKYDEDKDNFYCLQPLVVKKGSSDIWRIIDGQQRLTTIYLILLAFGKDKFELKYEREDYLSKLDSKEDKMELYFLKKSYNFIKAWIKNNKNKKDGLIKNLCNHTQFIWYDIDDKDEIQMFKNLNSGKISLTDAELIKALFLKKTSEEKKIKEIEQNALAEEFDILERRMREPSFWYFLNP